MVERTTEPQPEVWVLGRCWLYCRSDPIRVKWIGPVRVSLGETPMLACEICIAELECMATQDITRTDLASLVPGDLILRSCWTPPTRRLPRLQIGIPGRAGLPCSSTRRALSSAGPGSSPGKGAALPFREGARNRSSSNEGAVMPIQMEHIETVSTSVFAELITDVKSDPKAVAAGIQARVADAQSGAEVVMMGGWVN